MSRWSPSQHLYVKGNLRIGQPSLDGLETWLDQHGKNWTVVLMESASGEVWKDTRGVSYYGMDAVENALGRGLGNTKRFSDLKDLRTGQSNGAVFVLFLNERKFSYFGSDAFDHRGLGESAWAGNLDGPARDAMRNGGRIIEAVKNTVTYIESRLTQRIDYEKRLKREAAEQRERLRRMTQREIVDVRHQLDELQNEVGEFRAQAAVRNGDLASPPIPGWQRDLDAAGDALKAGHVETASTAVSTVRAKLANHHQLIQDWYHDGEELKKVGLRIDQVTLVDENRRGAEMLAAVQELYAKSKAGHSAGQSAYAAPFNQTIHALNKLESANALAVREKENRARRERERAEKIKNLSTVGGSVATLAVCLLGFGANRRRRKSKQHAEQVFAHWHEQMKGRFDRLFEVMDRAGVVVGSEKDLSGRGYEGETRSESINAIRAVDKAFILSSGVDDIIERVESLIHPSWLGTKLVNVFSRSRYERAIELLERQPVVAGYGRIKVADRDENSLLGDRAKDGPQCSQLTTPLAFASLIQQFDSTLDSATASLDRVDTAWETISARTGELGLVLSRIVRKERDVKSASLSDGWLSAEKLFSTWHPTARKLHAQGIDLGKHDPVAALDAPLGPIPRAEVMANEMLFVLEVVSGFRTNSLPVILDQTRSLRRDGRKTGWINDAIKLAGDGLNALAEAGTQQSVQAGCELFRDGLHALADRVAKALDLSGQSGRELPRITDTLRRAADDARGKLSRELHLSRQEILTERDEWNPDILLAESVGLRQTAESSLDHGAVELAADAMQSSRAALSLAEKLIRETITASSEFQARYTHAQTLAGEAESRKVEGIQVLDDLRKHYAGLALCYEPGSDGGDTFATAGETMQSAVQAMTSAITSADEVYRAGRIITARNHLIEAEDCHQRVLTLHGGLQQRQSDLTALDEQNSIRIVDALASLTGMQDATADPRICADTLAAFAQLETFSRDAERSVKAPYGESNPYLSELALDELDARLEAMETRISTDREAYAEAEQLIVAAETAAADAARVINVSQTDGIPDSSATHDFVGQIEHCRAALQECRRTLETEHSPWRELMKEINSQHTRLGVAMAGLKDELRKARQAVDSIRAARVEVNRAVMWSGSYGVRIAGSPGANHVQTAHELLSQGQYDDASRTAAFARTRARQAIAAAEVQEATIRRQREAAARRRASSSFNSSSGFSSSSSSSSSFGGSSSSSGFSSSSFSSGSGFSRSGW
ncbi:MAG: hypothetical protein H7A51_17915 [Akkermansiaceae bacterium]|nr:hypothetical protein [Akkermansiaceae bacterium]